MPLPDAPNTSPRVYTLLQNTDLETVTQANLATLGNPISVEELNEDELRRLVLVNLARLSVKSEWNGLLTAPTSSSPMERGYKSGWYYNLNPIQIYTETKQALSANKIRIMPFFVNKDITFDRISAYGGSTSGTADLSIGIYNMGSNGEPSTLVLEESFTNISSGYHTATISESLSAGWYFYFVWSNESVEYGVTSWNPGTLSSGLAPIYSLTSPSNYGGSLRVYNTTYSAGSAPDLSSTTPSQIEIYNVNMSFRVA